MSTDPERLLAEIAVALLEYAQRPRSDGLTTPPEVAGLARALVDALRSPHQSASFDSAAAGAEAEAMTEPTFLTRAEAARELRVSVSTVDRLIASGELPTVHVGRSVRIRPADLAALPARRAGSFRDRVSTKDAGTDGPRVAASAAKPSATAIGAGDPTPTTEGVRRAG